MKKIINLIITCALLLPQAPFASAAAPSNTIGRILLDVERSGEAHYVYPVDKKRYFLHRPYDAFKIIESLGLGITNNDLSKIPIGEFNFEDGKDSDNDGIGDNIEVSLGTNPTYGDTDRDGYNDYLEMQNNYDPTSNSLIKFAYDPALINRLLGRIVLQVERNGEAWYIHPVTHSRYFMGDPVSAFRVMKKQSLGVLHKVLEDIPEGLIYGALMDDPSYRSISDTVDVEQPSVSNDVLFQNSAYQIRIPANLNKSNKHLLGDATYKYVNDVLNRYQGVNGFVFENNDLGLSVGITTYHKDLQGYAPTSVSVLQELEVPGFFSLFQNDVTKTQEVISGINFKVFRHELTTNDNQSSTQLFYVATIHDITYEFGFVFLTKNLQTYKSDYIYPILNSFNPLTPVNYNIQQIVDRNTYFITDLFSGLLQPDWNIFELHVIDNEREIYIVDKNNNNNLISIERMKVASANTDIDFAKLYHDNALSGIPVVFNNELYEPQEPSWSGVVRKIDGFDGLSMGRIRDAQSATNNEVDLRSNPFDVEKVFVEWEGYLYIITITLDRGTYNERKSEIDHMLSNLKFNRFTPLTN